MAPFLLGRQKNKKQSPRQREYAGGGFVQFGGDFFLPLLLEAVWKLYIIAGFGYV